MNGATMLVQAQDVSVWFGRGASRVQALRGVTLSLAAGERLAVIGESGSGKSTLAKVLVGLLQPQAGSVRYGYGNAGSAERAPHAANAPDTHTAHQAPLAMDGIGMVLQNPFASLDPRWTIGASVAEPLRLQARRRHTHLSREEERAAVAQALEAAGLDAAFAQRFPSDMSGGQAQRAAIARAIIHQPSLLVADEPMSALDVVARQQVIDALARIHRLHPSMAMVVVSHDIGIVRLMADDVMVLLDGAVEERGSAQAVLAHPRSAYTRQLIEAASMPSMPSASKPAPSQA